MARTVTPLLFKRLQNSQYVWGKCGEIKMKFIFLWCLVIALYFVKALRKKRPLNTNIVVFVVAKLCCPSDKHLFSNAIRSALFSLHRLSGDGSSWISLPTDAESGDRPLGSATAFSLVYYVFSTLPRLTKDDGMEWSVTFLYPYPSRSRLYPWQMVTPSDLRGCSNAP